MFVLSEYVYYFIIFYIHRAILTQTNEKKGLIEKIKFLTYIDLSCHVPKLTLKLIWKIKSWKYLLQLEVSCQTHFWPSWSKCWPGSHETSVHLPNGDTDSMTKHSLNDWHLPSTGNFTLSVHFFVIGLNICLSPLPLVGHLYDA